MFLIELYWLSVVFFRVANCVLRRNSVAAVMLTIAFFGGVGWGWGRVGWGWCGVGWGWGGVGVVWGGMGCDGSVFHHWKCSFYLFGGL